MYSVIENGTLVEVADNAFGFVFKCYIPPVGYGINVSTGDLEETDIIKRSENQADQYWERIVLPADYSQRRKAEEKRQEFDKTYIDPYLEDIRVKEWGRRLRGVWFYNNGVLTYITQLHYFYLNWWKYQGKYLSYRNPDRETFYVVQYCVEDPHCLGINEITMRKSGKTARSACFAYERTSRMDNHHCGIQSKKDEDAWEVFKKGIIHPWQKLPHFYRPTFDLNKGDDPNDELRFFNTSRRGKEAATEQTQEALNSFIDFKTSEASAYDGPQLETYLSDETGKTRREVSVLERQNTTRYCTEIDGELVGKHWYTTTVEVEDDEEENFEFHELTEKSNPLVRDDNGWTLSGLYTIFQPAYKYMYFDKYGYPDEEKAKIFLINTRRKLEEEGKTRDLSSLKRKKPMTFQEAFSADGLNALYDPGMLNEQYENISWRNDLTERGNLEWEGGHRLKVVKVIGEETIEKAAKVIWVPSPFGRWEKIKGWQPKDPNSVVINNKKFLPNNNFANRIGCDPFKFDKTKDKRRSDCVAYNYQIKDDLYPDDLYNDTFTLEYSWRTETTREANEDILKMVWWCGCQVLFERNVDHWNAYFKENDCEGFLMRLPGEDVPGVYTDGKGTVVQMICNYTSSYIREFIKKVLFKKLIRKDVGWLGFKVEDTQKFDRPMAAGITLIAVKGKRYTRPSDHTRNIEDIMPYSKTG